MILALPIDGRKLTPHIPNKGEQASANRQWTRNLDMAVSPLWERAVSATQYRVGLLIRLIETEAPKLVEQQRSARRHEEADRQILEDRKL